MQTPEIHCRNVMVFLHKISMKLTSDKRWEVKRKKLKLKAHKMCLHTRKPGVLFLSIADQMQLNAILFCSLQYTAHSSCKRQRYFTAELNFDKRWVVKRKKLELKAHKMCLHTRKLSSGVCVQNDGRTPLIAR